MKRTAVILAAVLLFSTSFTLNEDYAASSKKSASGMYEEQLIDDLYEVDSDPDDPDLNDDEWDAAHANDPDPDEAPGINLNDEGNDSTENPEDPQNPIYDWFGVQGNNKGKITFLTNKKGKRYEYRSMAGQKMYGYDTFQGACSHSNYSWHILYNRRNNKCRVIKVSLVTNHVVKVSKILPLDHGNDMAYDEKRDQLVVVHYEPHPRRLSVIDPDTLKVIKVKNINTPTERVSGASTKFSKSIKGVTGIGYDDENDEYIVSIMGTRHYMALDAETFKILRVIKVPDLKPYVRQGMTVKDGFIIRAYSPYNRKYNQNILYVYDFAGNFIKTCKLGTGYEIESVFFYGDLLYAPTYRSYLKKKTRTIRQNGKKVKKPYYALTRDDNMINIKKY